MKHLILISLLGLCAACSTTPQKPQGYELPPALREVFRGGVLTPLQNSNAELGMPRPYDLVTHSCTSTPIFGMDGRYVRTDVQCW